MEEKHDIVAPVFKAKGKPVSRAKISSRPVVKMKAGNIQFYLFFQIMLIKVEFDFAIIGKFLDF